MVDIYANGEKVGELTSTEGDVSVNGANIGYIKIPYYATAISETISNILPIFINIIFIVLILKFVIVVTNSLTKMVY